MCRYLYGAEKECKTHLQINTIVYTVSRGSCTGQTSSFDYLSGLLPKALPHVKGLSIGGEETHLPSKK